MRSTITIPREKREALLEDLQQASGYTAATQDWEILSDWYHWCSNEGGKWRACLHTAGERWQ